MYRSIIYNSTGQREKIVYGNSTETQYTYERETFRLTSLTTTRTTDNKCLQEISYTYDPVGNITEIIDKSHGRVYNSNLIVDPKNEFVYDALYQLTEAQGREHLGLNNPLLSNYQEFKQSVFADINDSQQLSKYTQDYTYDKAGNLTQIRHVNQTDSSRSFTRNMVVASGSNRAIPDSMGTNVAPYFDSNGNMTALEHLVGIVWNYHDNISKATIISRPASTDDAEYYIYNSSGQRVRKIKETLVAGNIEIEEKIYLGGVEIKRIRTGSLKILERSDLHVMDDKSRIAIVNHWTVDTNNREVNSSADLNTNKIRYQYGNHLGSASLELNATGQIISYEEYFPYGGTSFATGNNQKEVKLKEYRYTGKERDDATGLYYYGARYYASWLGRWISADPSGAVDGLNLYVYVKNNPINLIDPNGKKSDDNIFTETFKRNGQEYHNSAELWGRDGLKKKGQHRDGGPSSKKEQKNIHQVPSSSAEFPDMYTSLKPSPLPKDLTIISLFPNDKQTILAENESSTLQRISDGLEEGAGRKTEMFAENKEKISFIEEEKSKSATKQLNKFKQMKNEGKWEGKPNKPLGSAKHTIGRAERAAEKATTIAKSAKVVSTGAKALSWASKGALPFVSFGIGYAADRMSGTEHDKAFATNALSSAIATGVMLTTLALTQVWVAIAISIIVGIVSDIFVDYLWKKVAKE